MKVETYLFGAVEANPENFITFPNGLVGFENSKQFMLAHEDGKGDPASFTLQSVEDPALAFQIADPTGSCFNFELALTDAEIAALQNPAPEDVAVMLVLFRQQSGDEQKMSANFRAPLIINTKARLGIQKVIENLRPNITISNLSSAV